MQEAAQSCSQKKCCGDNYGQGSGLATGKDSKQWDGCNGMEIICWQIRWISTKELLKTKARGAPAPGVCCNSGTFLHCLQPLHCQAYLGSRALSPALPARGSYPMHQQSPPRAMPAPPGRAWRVMKLPSVTLLNNWLIVMNSFAIHCDNVNQDELIEPSHCTRAPWGIPPPFRD